jgi:hypothetical protein
MVRIASWVSAVVWGSASLALSSGCDSEDAPPAQQSDVGSVSNDPATSGSSSVSERSSGTSSATPSSSGSTSGSAPGSSEADSASPLASPTDPEEAAQQIADCQNAASPIDPTCAVRLAAEAYCTKVDCCEEDELPLTSFLETCRQQVIVNRAFIARTLDRSTGDGLASWDGGAFESCLASARDCSNQEDPVDCLSASITGNQAIGDSCNGDLDCAAGASCFTGSQVGVSGTCGPLAQPGEPCDSQDDCAFGGCSFIDGTCDPGPFGETGASCDFNDECQTNDCDGDGPGTTGVCVARRVCFSAE